jgi:DALR anticodon binding domain
VVQNGFKPVSEAGGESHAIIHYFSLTQWLTDRLSLAVKGLQLSLSDAQPVALPSLVVDPKELGVIATPLPLKLVGLVQEAVGTNVIAAAQTLGNDLIAQLEHPLQPSWIAPRYTMHPKGWLYARFSSEALAHWLQSLLSIQPRLQTPTQNIQAKVPGISADPLQFELQYAHARCCSLLRMGQQAQLIRLEERNGCIHLIEPSPLPWNTPQGLRLSSPAEHRLLLALMQFPASLSKPAYGAAPPHPIGHQTSIVWPPEDHIVQQQVQWSQLFESFYRECRVLGMQAESRELAQTRLGFILLLKNVLGFWLQAILNLDAPHWL